MNQWNQEEIRSAVRKQYDGVATSQGVGCGAGGCCTGGNEQDAHRISQELGYSTTELASVPDGANLGLGCGNPQAIADLREGERVLDLGSGAGFDCFLAANQVGASGKVVGVDMTPSMISKARENAFRREITNVTFRLGEIENLPVANDSIDVILSNCVINLSPDKPRVFVEAFRVLRPGGRLAISDVVSFAPVPVPVQTNADLYAGCVSGAESIAALQQMLEDAGFEDIRIAPKSASRDFLKNWVPGMDISQFVVSATIEARKPIG